VRALCDNLDESQSAVSHHLTLLRGAGLVRVRRDGKRSFYHLEGGPLQELLDAIFADLPKEKRRFRFENLLLTYSPAARS
jgi:ArsR family transcriptional regulator